MRSDTAVQPIIQTCQRPCDHNRVAPEDATTVEEVMSIFRTARGTDQRLMAHRGQAWASRTSTLPSRTRVR
jgi:hypothetical protein